MKMFLRMLSLLLITLSILSTASPVEAQPKLGKSPPKLIVRVYLTYLWINNRADVDALGRGNSDLWLISIINEYGHGTSPFIIGEKTVDEDLLDVNGNNVYDKGDNRMRILELAGPLESDKGPKKIRYTDLAYNITQCEPLRPFDIYVHLVDSDNGNSDEYRFALKLLTKLFNGIFKTAGPFSKLVTEAMNGVFSVFGKGGYDSAGVGSVNSWYPSKAYPVLAGNPKKGQMWNLGKPKEWKKGDIPPPKETWVSEEGKIDIKLNGKLSAIVWFRISVYNTGIACKKSYSLVPSEKGEGAASIREATIKELPNGKMGFQVKFHGNITGKPLNLSLKASNSRSTGEASIAGDMIKRSEGDSICIDEHNDTIYGLMNLSGLEGSVNVSITSYSGSLPVSKIENITLYVHKPELAIVANEVDLDPLMDELPEIEAKGFHYSIYKPDEVGILSDVPVILILGGPDAYNGVGSLVRSLLPEDKQQEMRGGFASYIIPNAFSGGKVNQKVILVGGKDRYMTAETMRRIMPSIIEDLSAVDREPPYLVGWNFYASSMAPEIATGTLEGTNLTLYWSEPLSQISLGISARYGNTSVPLPRGSANVSISGAETRIYLAKGLPKDLIVSLGGIKDTRGNSLKKNVTLRLKVAVEEGYPYLMLKVVGNESVGRSFTYYVQIMNLGDSPGVVRYGVTQAPPPFIEVRVQPEMVMIPPQQANVLSIVVNVGEEAVPGTYPFQVTFYMDSYGGTRAHPLNLTVRVWTEG